MVSDINKILDYFQIKDEIYLFGGSWGSTLSLVFAIRYPEKIKGMILRGIYLPCAPKHDFLFGNEKPYLFPDKWADLLAKVPEANRDNICQFFVENLNMSQGDEQRNWAYDFTLFEAILAFLDPDILAIEKRLKTDDKLVDSARIEANYIAQNAFIPLNYILDNARKIENIPTRIVHGRYDAICPAHDAWQLHELLNDSTIEFPLAGHSTSDPNLREALIRTVKSFIK